MEKFLKNMQEETGLDKETCLKVMKHLDKSLRKLDDPHAESYGYFGKQVHELLKSFRKEE